MQERKWELTVLEGKERNLREENNVEVYQYMIRRTMNEEQ